MNIPISIQQSLRHNYLSQEFWYKFESKNCEPSCKGWDGWSTTCNCGKSKLRWYFSGYADNVKIIPKVI